MKVSQDVPKYMMVAGQRAELRGLNLLGLTRRGFSTAEVYANKKVQILVAFNYVIAAKPLSWLTNQIEGLRAAYRKIFMSIDANARSFEERLAEVVCYCFFYCLEEVSNLS